MPGMVKWPAVQPEMFKISIVQNRTHGHLSLSPVAGRVCVCEGGGALRCKAAPAAEHAPTPADFISKRAQQVRGPGVDGDTRQVQ